MPLEKGAFLVYQKFVFETNCAEELNGFNVNPTGLEESFLLQTYFPR